MKLICMILGHQMRRWQIKNNNQNPEKLCCIGGITMETYSQLSHRKNCGCKNLDFYICKRCKKDLTLWTKYKPDPVNEYLYAEHSQEAVEN